MIYKCLVTANYTTLHWNNQDLPCQDLSFDSFQDTGIKGSSSAMWILSIEVEMMISHFVLNRFPMFQCGKTGKNTENNPNNMTTHLHEYVPRKIRFCPSNIAYVHTMQLNNFNCQLPVSEILSGHSFEGGTHPPTIRVAKVGYMHIHWDVLPPRMLVADWRFNSGFPKT